jgi:hypothetical protein
MKTDRKYKDMQVNFHSKITRLVTPLEFLRIVKNKSYVISRSKIIPPKLGSNNFGKILIEYKNESF